MSNTKKIFPRKVAIKLGFKREYTDDKNGVEIWARGTGVNKQFIHVELPKPERPPLSGFNFPENQPNGVYENVVKITESELKQIVNESVKNVLNEASYDANGNFDADAHNTEILKRVKTEQDEILKFLWDKYKIIDMLYKRTVRGRIPAQKYTTMMVRGIVEAINAVDQTRIKL